MKITWRRSSTTADESAGRGHPWSGGSALVTRGMAALLWGALLCGPVAVVVAMQGGGGAGASASAVMSEAMPTAGRDTASAFAEQVVVTWLTANGADGSGQGLDQLVGVGAGQGLPEAPLSVANPAVAAIVESGPGVWSVTVAADVVMPVTAETADGAQETTGGEDSRPIRRYFQVPVGVSQDGVVAALAAPAPVPAPRQGPVPQHGYAAPVTLASPVGVAVGEFLSALLAGAGGLERVVAPGVDLEPVAPAPYTAVDVTGIDAVAEPARDPADGDRVQVLVTASVVHATGEAVVQYPLALVARAGRWEIEAIDPAPVGDRAVQDSGSVESVMPSPPAASGADSSSTATP